MKPTNNISACLWFDDQGEEAAKFYTSVFDNAKIKATTHYTEESAGPSGRPVGSVLTVGFEIEGFPFMALNGGPHFKKNPSISFFVNCDSGEEVDTLWDRLINGGKALMPLDKYDFAARYGWVQDKYGTSWQLIFGDKPEEDWRPKIIPSFLFTNEKSGKTKEALEYYVSIFENSEVGLIAPNDKPGTEGTTAFADFMLENQWFASMDSPTESDFTFNEGVSIMVFCDTQEEIDHYWEELTSNGGEESVCGWLKDKYGISWQIVPRDWRILTSTKAAMQAMMQMKKLDIQALKEAAR